MEQQICEPLIKLVNLWKIEKINVGVVNYKKNL